MTTTDDKTPDPTPALLSAGRPLGHMSASALDKLRAWHAAALDQTSYPMIVAGALLAHLDALTPRAPVDGEALGRLLATEIASATVAGEDTMAKPALALRAIGYAAGRSEGEAAESETTRHLIEQRNLAQRTAEDAHREIARLTAELAEANERETRQINGGGDIAERDRLTAALSDLDALYQEQVRESHRLAADRERMEDERDAATAELAEALATGERWKVACERQEQANASADREDDKRVAAARLDGAREERRLCLFDVRRAMGGEDAGANDALAEAERAILGRGDPGLARATEGRQG
jgi:hypothetical protein